MKKNNLLAKIMAGVLAGLMLVSVLAIAIIYMVQ